VGEKNEISRSHSPSDPSRLERIRQVLAERLESPMLDGTHLHRFGSLDADDGRFLLAEIDKLTGGAK
jgi:hypothetical protein